jgi:signal transduction histidine kinase
MKLNSKITVILTISFFVIASVFITASLTALGRNQTDNLSLFKNEFVETNLEAFQDSSDLFFTYLDNEIDAGRIASQSDLTAFIQQIDPTGENVILMDLKSKNFIGNSNNPQLSALLTPQTVDSFISQWTLNPSVNDFSVDDFDKFTTGDTTITPARVRVQVYDNLGLIIGYGKVFETGKVRIDFIQQQNAIFYRTYLLVLLVIFLLAATLIPLFSILFMKKVVVDPVKRLNLVTQKITEGDLARRVDVTSSDEIGELSGSFNTMTEKLVDSNRNLSAKVKELSEEHGRLSSLVESVKLGVVMVDLRLNVILANPAAKAVFGKSTSKNFTFNDLSEKIKGSVNISQALSYYVRTGKPLNIQEVMIGESYYRLFMSPVRDIIEHIFIGAVVVMEDITEQKKLDTMRTEIISITSHQLRTPATIVKGNLEMVLGGDAGKITKMQKELLDDTYMGNERMIHLINDLMDATKINEGKLVFPLESIQLEDLIAEVIEENSLFAKEKKVVVSFVRPESPLSKVKINRQRVKQVLQNLLDNAIKYSSIGDKGRVAVGLENDGKYLRLTVKDNGIGIPKGDQSKIFERFSRGSNSTKLDPGGGSGLGLYIAKAVVEQGGGKVWFDSKEGEGTTFYATFPLL